MNTSTKPKPTRVVVWCVCLCVYPLKGKCYESENSGTIISVSVLQSTQPLR